MLTTGRSLFANRRAWIIVLAVAISIAIVEHLAWALHVGLQATTATGEMQNVAIAVATKGEIADAYRVGQGPTAHVMPLTPLLAGAIYRLFGPLSTTSELILLGWATALAIGSFLVGYQVFHALGSRRTARRVALVALLAFPFNLSFEAGWFRIWEGSLAALLGLVFLGALLRYDAKRDFGPGPTLVVAFAAALLMFVNPPLGAPAYICAVLCMVTRQPWRIWWRTTALAALALVVVFTPWVIRNERVFGHFVPLRDNFGIEYSIGMDPSAPTPAEEEAAFHKRIDQIHPMHSGETYARMERVGEYQYSKDLTRETNAFIAAHTATAARLMLRHLQSYFFPPRWMWTSTADGSVEKRSTLVQRYLHYAIAALAIAAAIWRLFGRDPRWRYVALMMLLPGLTYMLTLPQARYSYIVFVLQVYLAADLTGRLLGRLAGGRPNSLSATGTAPA